MLCPEVWNFPSPIIKTFKKNGDMETATKILQMNNFYKSAIITCPDEINVPQDIEDQLEDSDYYKIFNCPLTFFLDPILIQNFVKSGKIYCLSDSSCIVDNCAAVTPDGILTLHVLEPLYQTLGLEGRKLPHNYYQLDIDLINLKNIDRTRKALAKFKLNFYVTWEPDEENVCPSSIAKYFCDKGLEVSCHSLEVLRLSPNVKEIPTLDSDLEELVEWIGMLAIGGNLSPKESYVSTYTEPECDASLKSTRISVLIVKGFLNPNLLLNMCKSLLEYVSSRELKDYWGSISVQSIEDSLWQWNISTGRMFQSQNCSCNIFFSGENCTICSVGELKYP